MSSSRRLSLQLVLGGLCAAAGVAAWISLGWSALLDPDSLTPNGGEGGRLMVRGLVGTVLMVVGVILAQFSDD